ncbi:hypothetical protein AMEX_G20608 [Astyanax mexicanus]|uniref:Uncharacterized protein n=1 Tax=Astyanax mexicanus TaxID=7994 RepID=A0A8T2L7W2_ASTMX|nr:hypothetical protein AMEX_G20608 [Astyanax mexicanus]
MKWLCCVGAAGQCSFFNDLAAVGVRVGEEWRQSRELFWAGAAVALDSHHTLERVFIVQVHKKAGVLLISLSLHVLRGYLKTASVCNILKLIELINK